MEIYLIKNTNGDVLIKIVQLENVWTIAFMFFNTKDKRFRDCLIGAIEKCGGEVQGVMNESVTNGVNYCIINFTAPDKYFFLAAPEHLCSAAKSFLGVGLTIEKI